MGRIDGVEALAFTVKLRIGVDWEVDLEAVRARPYAAPQPRTGPSERFMGRV